MATVLGGLDPAPLNVDDLVGRRQLKRLLGQAERRVGRSPRAYRDLRGSIRSVLPDADAQLLVDAERRPGRHRTMP